MRNISNRKVKAENTARALLLQEIDTHIQIYFHEHELS